MQPVRPEVSVRVDGEQYYWCDKPPSSLSTTPISPPIHFYVNRRQFIFTRIVDNKILEEVRIYQSLSPLSAPSSVVNVRVATYEIGRKKQQEDGGCLGERRAPDAHLEDCQERLES